MRQKIMTVANTGKDFNLLYFCCKNKMCFNFHFWNLFCFLDKLVKSNWTMFLNLIEKI